VGVSEPLTMGSLKEAIAQKLNISCDHIKSLRLQTGQGMSMIMTDEDTQTLARDDIVVSSL